MEREGSPQLLAHPGGVHGGREGTERRGLLCEGVSSFWEVRPVVHLDGVGKEAEGLRDRLHEADVGEPALHLLPLLALGLVEPAGVALEGLVEDGEEEEGRGVLAGVRARGPLRELLQDEEVALLGVEGRVFEDLAELVHHDEEAASGGLVHRLCSPVEQPEGGRLRLFLDRLACLRGHRAERLSHDEHLLARAPTLPLVALCEVVEGVGKAAEQGRA